MKKQFYLSGQVQGYPADPRVAHGSSVMRNFVLLNLKDGVQPAVNEASCVSSDQAANFTSLAINISSRKEFH